MRGTINLIECMLVLCLIAVLSLLAVPNWLWYQKNHQADQAIYTLQQALNTTKMLALSRHQNLSLCPSLDQNHCQNQWQSQLLIFINVHDSSQPSQNNDILARLPLQAQNGHIHWRHFYQRAWLTFTDTGQLQQDNGTFLYCPSSINTAFNRALSINSQGRIRLIEQRNQAGQLLDDNGQPLLCTE